MAYLTPSPKMQFFTANGIPLVGGKLYTYVSGTTTPLATYVDQLGSASNPNPVIMDSRGEAGVWLANAQLYTMVLKDSLDNLIWTSDGVGSSGATPLASTFKVQNFSGDGTTVAFVLTYEPPNENNTQIYINGAYQQKNTYSLAASTITFSSAPPLGTNNIEVMTIATLSFGYIDSSLVNYIPAGTGAVPTTVQEALHSITVNIERFLPVGYVTNGTVDYTTYVQAAINTGASLCFDGITVLISANLLPRSNTRWEGKNSGGIKYLPTGINWQPMINCQSISNFTVDGLTVDGNLSGYLIPISSLYAPWGFLAEACDGITVQNCIFKNCYRIGVMVGWLSTTVNTNVLIQNNVVQDCGGTGDPSAAFGNGIAVMCAKGLRILGNTVRTITGNGGATAGINIEPGAGQLCVNIDIVGNRVTDINNAAGIQGYMVFALTASRNNINVLDNYIQNTGTAKGIYFRQFGRTVIQNNYLESTQGISVSHYLDGRVTIIDNEVSGTTAGNGIEVINGCLQAVISRNRISNVVGMGIYTDVNDANATTIKSLHIESNDLMDVSSHGISFVGYQFVIQGNVLTRCCTANTSGYYLQPVAGGSAINGCVAGNTFTHFSGTILGFIRCEGNVFDQTYFGTNTFVGTPTKFQTSALAGRCVGAYVTGVPPSGGTWQVGDVLYQTVPTSAGFIGWVCTAAGTPGTWKTYGLIS